MLRFMNNLGAIVVEYIIVYTFRVNANAKIWFTNYHTLNILLKYLMFVDFNYE